jgi:hypothetical protein
MQCVGVRGILSRVLGVAIAAVTVAGCVTTAASVPPEHAYGATVAFESLDGLPSEPSAKLMSILNEEAKAQQLVVLPRGGQANYRLRGYVSPHMESRAVAWAWDVYDGSRRRVARVTGIEPVPGSWLDEALARRIARASLEHVTAAIAANRAPASAAAAESPASQRLWVVTAFDDFRPEAAGIMRVFGPTTAEPPPSETPSTEIPVPRRRPVPGSMSIAAAPIDG